MSQAAAAGRTAAPFAHLHVASAFSAHHGVSWPEDLVAAAEQTSDETSAGGLASLVLIRGARYVLEAGTEYKVRTFAGTVPTVAEHAGDSASLSELCDDHDWS